LVSGNIMHDINGSGVVFSPTFNGDPSQCGNNTIFNNTFSNCRARAIIISHPGNVGFCNYNNITGNIANNNNVGIEFDQDGSYWNVVDSNIINNGYNGLFISHSLYNNLTNNLINGSNIGLWIQTSSNSNLFINNTVNLGSQYGGYFNENCNLNSMINNTFNNSFSGFIVYQST